MEEGRGDEEDAAEGGNSLRTVKRSWASRPSISSARMGSALKRPKSPPEAGPGCRSRGASRSVRAKDSSAEASCMRAERSMECGSVEEGEVEEGGILVEDEEEEEELVSKVSEIGD